MWEALGSIPSIERERKEWERRKERRKEWRERGSKEGRKTASDKVVCFMENLIKRKSTSFYQSGLYTNTHKQSLTSSHFFFNHNGEVVVKINVWISSFSIGL
jgi:hypothetical protein